VAIELLRFLGDDSETMGVPVILCEEEFSLSIFSARDFRRERPNDQQNHHEDFNAWFFQVTESGKST
jgi:hypothetical protein